MKIVKPQCLSLLMRPVLLRGRHRLCLTSVLAFPLGQRRALASEIALWPAAAEACRGAIDEGLPKVKGEVLVFGSCHNLPAPRAVSQIRVRVSPPTATPLAEKRTVDKRLAVIGDRWWHRGVFTPPQPFTIMPITWALAFGGPKFDR